MRRDLARFGRCNLHGTIWTARLGLGRWSDGLFVLLAHSLYSLFLLFLSLSLGVCESENHLKVKQKRKWFSRSKGLFYDQSLRFSEKFYFTCAPKHTAGLGCKIFSRNHLHPKQTQPKWKNSLNMCHMTTLHVLIDEVSVYVRLLTCFFFLFYFIYFL